MALNRDKVQKAKANPKRPGEDCRAPPGDYVPKVDRNRCEGKGDCTVVCPEGVFEVRTIEPPDFAKLSIVGKLKNIVHGRKTVYLPAIDQCRGCGLCVVACPEKAIELNRSM